MKKYKVDQKTYKHMAIYYNFFLSPVIFIFIIVLFIKYFSAVMFKKLSFDTNILCNTFISQHNNGSPTQVVTALPPLGRFLLRSKIEYSQYKDKVPRATVYRSLCCLFFPFRLVKS